MRILPKILLTVTLAIPLTGCVMEGIAAYKYLSRTQVSYADEKSFECTEVHIPNGSRDFSACAKCQNMSAVSQHVVIAETPYEVPPRAVLMSCQSKAWLLE